MTIPEVALVSMMTSPRRGVWRGVCGAMTSASPGTLWPRQRRSGARAGAHHILEPSWQRHLFALSSPSCRYIVNPEFVEAGDSSDGSQQFD